MPTGYSYSHSSHASTTSLSKQSVANRWRPHNNTHAPIRRTTCPPLFVSQARRYLVIRAIRPIETERSTRNQFSITSLRPHSHLLSDEKRTCSKLLDGSVRIINRTRTPSYLHRCIMACEMIRFRYTEWLIIRRLSGGTW